MKPNGTYCNCLFTLNPPPLPSSPALLNLHIPYSQSYWMQNSVIFFVLGTKALGSSTKLCQSIFFSFLSLFYMTMIPGSLLFLVSSGNSSFTNIGPRSVLWLSVLYFLNFIFLFNLLGERNGALCPSSDFSQWVKSKGRNHGHRAEW